MSKIAVVIATYTRPDGSTPERLKLTLESINNQTHGDYHIYLIGDAYEDPQELKAMLDSYSKLTWFNLPNSPERDRYGTANINIWHAAGTTAANTGIAMALADGYEYIAHLSHDDLWYNNHLAVINKVIEEKHPFFVCTISSYVGRILPDIAQTNEIIPFYPIECGMIASSACVKYSDTQTRVVDPLLAVGLSYPADAYLWRCLKKEMQHTGKMGFIVSTLTCRHDEEGYAQTH